jgi:hypothetical protein
MDPHLEQLLHLLDSVSSDTTGTSVRLPANLRDAATLAAQLGLIGSTSELAIRGIRDALEALAQRAILDAHYRAHPGVQPDLGEIALATAQLDANPLAQRPDLVLRAAKEIDRVKQDATPDDVLLYAAGIAASVA